METENFRNQIFTGPSGAETHRLPTATHGLITTSLVDSAATLA